MADKLPEGFFDDPILDAKVRKVEYVDKEEEEWNAFQKAMKGIFDIPKFRRLFTDYYLATNS